MNDPIKCAGDYTRALFARLEEFFLRATGMAPAKFATVETFGDVVRASAQEIGPRGLDAFAWLDTEIRNFQATHGLAAFEAARQLGGMKLILGGNSRFGRSHLNAVGTAALYTDTVLIPDPVMPWLERERREEQFRHVLVLKAVHALLQLKPLVDADLRYPAVVVFPSWEKSLEDHDSTTQEGILQLITDVLSHFLSETFTSLDDVKGYADRYAEQFCEAVDRSHLFVGPNGPVDEPLLKALARYEKEINTWRSKAWIDGYGQLPIQHRILNGIGERITPLYHLIENVGELNGNPLMCVEQHAHYFRLMNHASSAHLEKLGVLDAKTMALVNALGSRRLQWLGGIPTDILAKLRLDNENVKFRERLTAAISRLHQTVFDNVDRVAAEVCQELETAIAEHEKELRLIQKKYDRVHGNTAVLTLAAAGAALMPALAPFLSSATPPLILAAKYAHDKVNELAEKRALTVVCRSSRSGKISEVTVFNLRKLKCSNRITSFVESCDAISNSEK